MRHERYVAAEVGQKHAVIEFVMKRGDLSAPFVGHQEHVSAAPPNRVTYRLHPPKDDTDRRRRSNDVCGVRCDRRQISIDWEDQREVSPEQGSLGVVPLPNGFDPSISVLETRIRNDRQLGHAVASTSLGPPNTYGCSTLGISSERRLHLSRDAARCSIPLLGCFVHLPRGTSRRVPHTPNTSRAAPSDELSPGSASNCLTPP